MEKKKEKLNNTNHSSIKLCHSLGVNPVRPSVSHCLVGVITQAVVDKNGHVLLLDAPMAQVLEISPDGEFLGTLSRMGQGPGELQLPKVGPQSVGKIQFTIGKMPQHKIADARIAAGSNTQIGPWKIADGNVIVNQLWRDVGWLQGSCLHLLGQ